MVEITRQPAPPYGTKIIPSRFSRRTSRQLRERHLDQLEHYLAQPPGAERGLRLERSLGLVQGLFFHSLEVGGYIVHHTCQNVKASSWMCMLFTAVLGLILMFDIDIHTLICGTLTTAIQFVGT